MEKNKKDKFLNLIGSSVDNLFLSIPRILKPLKPTIKIDRETYERQIDFYIENEYTDNPADFFYFPENMPAYNIESEMPYNMGLKQIITFDSMYEARNPLIRNKYNSYKNNRKAHIVRWTHNDGKRKTVMCLHGFMLGEPRQAENMFKIKDLFNSGLDVVLFIAPFHWRRAHESVTLRGFFLQPDNVVMTAECIGQTMHDLYASFLILRNMGSNEIGIIGASLGGYNASIFSCLSDIHSFAAMMVPAVNFSKPFGPDSIKLPFKTDENLKKKINLVWEFHSPLNMLPKISKDKILIVASRGDLLCPFEYIKDLTERWNNPRHYFLSGGHWLIFNNVRGKVWYGFLKDMGFIE